MFRNAIKVSLVGCCMALLLTTGAAKARAADFEVETVFEDSLYGAAIGTLVGGGVMLVSGHPTDHWNYLLTGAGIGILAGAAYGMYTSSRSFAEIEDGKMVVGIPTPKIRVQQYEETASIGVETDLLKVHF